MRWWFSALAVGMVACSADADGDGLSNGEEKDLGLNPDLADSDGDGLNDGDESAVGANPLEADTDGDLLNDGDEVAAGSDPTVEDTDGDGYLDFDEVTEGSDPADEKSKIYRGGWPYYRNKDELKGGSKQGIAEVGQRFGRFKLVDQFGDKVDLFDFYNEQDKMILIDQSAVWCGPCNSTAAYMDGVEIPDYAWLAPLREAVERGDIYWLTVLTQDGAGAPAQPSDAKEWYQNYKTKEIPVFADDEYAVANYMPAPGIPAFCLLEADLTVASFSASDGFVAIEEALARVQ
jgi:thiol-disulfide isomerase/thioredoxin